ncbi:piercer of microtubule wall 1 protein [Hemicordylus capensis]|uniref:piercer of microtubule wall 1 protein n=1 Tax=Hemicordylus capensis TaxID=884348 RepID=UPI002303B074|nr:piercer of microtubule wall 1 protein [Hemicordylus capensis]
MSQGDVPGPEGGAALCPKEAGGGGGGDGQRTSDFYRVEEKLPARFNHPGWFRGYRPKERNPLFRTSNMDYGAKPPTVHEMPTSYHSTPHTFSDHYVKFGMYRNSGINSAMDKSTVTGPDNFITFFDTFNFHPSYRIGGPSFCE